MLSSVDQGLTSLTSPTEAVLKKPSVLHATVPLAAGVGVADEIRKTSRATPKRDGSATEADLLLRQHWLGRQQEAVAEARALVARNNGSATAWARLAQAEHNADNVPQAVQAARRVLRLCEQDASGHTNADGPALYVAATVLGATQCATEAEEILERFRSSESHCILSATFAIQRGDYMSALTRLADASSSTAHTLKAWIMLQVGIPDRALTAIRTALRNGQPSPALLANMAFAYALLAQPHKAVRAAQQAVGLAPTSHKLSFSLVGYLLVCEQPRRALDELHRLCEARLEDDGDIALARAAVLVSMGERDRALQTLQAAATGGNQTPKSRRAEIEINCNIAVLRYLLGRSSKAQTLQNVGHHVRSAGGRSINAIAAYCDLRPHSSRYQEIVMLVHQAGEWHSHQDLLPLKARVAHLSGDHRREREATIAWLHAEPLNDMAACNLIHLLSVQGAYEKAADMGMQYLQRMPHSVRVRSNTAHCLAMIGKGDEARAVLPASDSVGNRVAVIATRGSAELAAGNIAQGCGLYKHAFRLAQEDATDSARLQAILALNQWIAFRRMELDLSTRWRDSLLPLNLPPDWKQMPSVVQLMRRARDEGYGKVSRA